MIIKETFVFSLIILSVFFGNTQDFKLSLAAGIVSFLVLLILWHVPLINKIMTYFCSLIWGLFIGNIITNLNLTAGIISGIAIFIISVFIHKLWFYPDDGGLDL